mgnify:CR=1 FL=1
MKPYQLFQRLGGGSGGSGGTTLKTGLVSWWDFEDGGGTTWVDSHGSNDFTASVSETSAAGKVGNAVAKVNTSYLTKAANSSLKFLTGDFTLAMWIKTAVADVGGLNRWAITSGGRSYLILIEGGVAKFGVSTDGDNVAAIATTGTSLNDDAWHLFVGWRSTTDGKVYIQVDNGTPASATFSGASTLFDCVADFFLGGLGASIYTGAAVFDSCAMWSRELDSTERGLLWNSGAGRNYASL